MAYQSIGLGTTADDGTGDTLRTGGDKVNDNFVELYTILGTGSVLTSGISSTATVVTLAAPTISGVVGGTQTSATITTLATTTVNGTTVNAGTLALAAGSVTDRSGAIDFGNENLTTAGSATTGSLKIDDGGTIGTASSTSAITIASTGIVTFVDDILLKNDGTIGTAGASTAMTISSAGIVTFVDDIKIKDGGTIGSASASTAMTVASTGIVTFVDDIIIKDGGTIGTSTTPAAITIASGGNITTSGTVTDSGSQLIGLGKAVAVALLF